MSHTIRYPRLLKESVSNSDKWHGTPRQGRSLYADAPTGFWSRVVLLLIVLLALILTLAFPGSLDENNPPAPESDSVPVISNTQTVEPVLHS